MAVVVDLCPDASGASGGGEGGAARHGGGDRGAH